MSGPRKYPPCPRSASGTHWFSKGRCACGVVKKEKIPAVSFETKSRLRGTSYFDTHTRGRWQAPDILAISATWPRISEAKSFFRLVQNGELTLEKAEADIRMSEAHRDLLLRSCDENEGRRIQAVFRAREQTWEAFLLLCAGEELEEKRNVYVEGYV